MQQGREGREAVLHQEAAITGELRQGRAGGDLACVRFQQQEGNSEPTGPRELEEVAPQACAWRFATTTSTEGR